MKYTLKNNDTHLLFNFSGEYDFNKSIELIHSIKSECINKMLIFGESHLRYVVGEYMEHYHTERPHKGIGNEIISPQPQGKGKIVCQERLGGLLKSYRRAA